VKQNGHRSHLESGYDLSAFKIDWDGHFAICPQGKKSTGWWSATSHTGRVTIHTKFSRTDCAKCRVNQLCTKNGSKNSRKLGLLPREEHEWLAATRIEQRTPEWKQLYSKRAGIEGTIPQGVRATTVAVSRAFQDSFAKHSCRMRHQCSKVDGLLVRRFPGCDTHIGLRANWRMGRVTDFANSIQ
jgi:hypothetical protein